MRRSINEFFDTYYEQVYEQIDASRRWVGPPGEVVKEQTEEDLDRKRQWKLEYNRRYWAANRHDTCECGNRKQKTSKRCKECAENRNQWGA